MMEIKSTKRPVNSMIVKLAYCVSPAYPVKTGFIYAGTGVGVFNMWYLFYIPAIPV